MFNSYEFTFDGESSAMYGLMIYDIDGKKQSDVPFGTIASIVEKRTTNRITPLHFGVNYHEKPLEFSLVFGTDRALDRFEMEAVSLWLMGHQDYKWLTISQPDLEHVQFRCIITELTPISHGWLPVAFEAKIRCDCPYAYGYPFEFQYPIRGETNILFRNESSTREFVKPTLVFTPASGTRSLSIVNHDDRDREFNLSGLPSSGLNIIVDNANGIIRETTYNYNLYDGFNLNFFRLVHGDNNLVVNGDGLLTITGQFLYNIAG